MFKKLILIFLLIMLIPVSAIAGTISVDSYNAEIDTIIISWDYTGLVNIYSDSGLELKNYPDNTYTITDYSKDSITSIWITDNINGSIYSAKATRSIPTIYTPNITFTNLFNYERSILIFSSILFIIFGIVLWYFFIPAIIIQSWLFVDMLSNTTDERLIIIFALFLSITLFVMAWRVKQLQED